MEPFGVLYADPPWKFGDRLPGKGRGAAKHYDLLTVRQIKEYRLPPLKPDAWLFMWRVAAMQQEALDVVEAWGFTPVKAEVVWVKTTVCARCRGERKHKRTGEPCDYCDARGWNTAMGMGRAVRNCHETCIIAKRGRPERLSSAERSVIFAPRLSHSEKPEEVAQLIERLAKGPYCELFARRYRAGWICAGKELALTGAGHVRAVLARRGAVS